MEGWAAAGFARSGSCCARGLPAGVPQPRASQVCEPCAGQRPKGVSLGCEQGRWRPEVERSHARAKALRVSRGVMAEPCAGRLAAPSLPVYSRPPSDLSARATGALRFQGLQGSPSRWRSLLGGQPAAAPSRREPAARHGRIAQRKEDFVELTVVPAAVRMALARGRRGGAGAGGSALRGGKRGPRSAAGGAGRGARAGRAAGHTLAAQGERPTSARPPSLAGQGDPDR